MGGGVFAKRDITTRKRNLKFLNYSNCSNRHGAKKRPGSANLLNK